MWALVFVCEGLCHESSAIFFNSEDERYKEMRDKAAAQIKWAGGRFRYINERNGIRQAAVFAEHFQHRWDTAMVP